LRFFTPAFAPRPAPYFLRRRPPPAASTPRQRRRSADTARRRVAFFWLTRQSAQPVRQDADRLLPARTQWMPPFARHRSSDFAIAFLDRGRRRTMMAAALPHTDEARCQRTPRQCRYAAALRRRCRAQTPAVAASRAAPATLLLACRQACRMMRRDAVRSSMLRSKRRWPLERRSSRIEAFQRQPIFAVSPRYAAQLQRCMLTQMFESTEVRSRRRFAATRLPPSATTRCM